MTNDKPILAFKKQTRYIFLLSGKLLANYFVSRPVIIYLVYKNEELNFYTNLQPSFKSRKGIIYKNILSAFKIKTSVVKILRCMYLM